MIKLNKKVISADVFDILYNLRNYIEAKDNKLFMKDLKDGPDNVMVTCPFHKDGNERRPSCGVQKVDKEGSPAGMVHCFTCGKGMFIDKFISYLLGYDDDGEEGRKWLLNNFDVSYTRKINFDMLPRGSKEKVENYISDQFLRNYRYFHPYMYKRGLTDEIIEKYDIGYDPINDMITFPVRDIKGNCLFLAKRSVRGKKFILPSEQNKPLYGVFELDYNKSDVYICESFFNALTLAVWGYNAIAMMGTGSKSQYDLINNLPFRSIHLCLDGDFAGHMGTKKLIHFIRKDKMVYTHFIPEGKDVNDLTKQQFEELQIERR